LRIEDGHALAPQDPGLGIAWDWSAIARRQSVYLELK
jgi:L-alanine-DL-glutamate epimerase-like enolase superfamily enzyme